MHARRASVALVALACLAAGCQPSATAVHWTCDFDASENRPLSDPDAALGPDGSLPESVCENTCGTPALRCTFVELDGGVPGATCPVCTF
jgi:hypothetical protein